MKTDFIVIWGLRRSGASLLAASLELFGAALGANISFPGEAGLAGAFEDSSLVRLNDDMLQYLGLSWHTLCEVGESETRILCEAGFLKRAIDYLRSRASDGPIIGLKDPRMTRLGLIWSKAFAELDTRPYSIVCFRNPLIVAQYLRRGALRKIFPGFFLDTDYSQLLWLGYTLGSLIYTDKYPRVLVEYDSLLERPEQTLREIAKNLNLDFENQKIEAFNDIFISREKASPRIHIEDSSDLIPKAGRLYRLLSGAPLMEFPPSGEVGPMWPHEDIEKIMTNILARAFRENRDLRTHIDDLAERIGKSS